MKKTHEPITECAHCHQPLTERIYGDNPKIIYCCYGCKVVDELLAGKGRIISHSHLNIAKYAFLDEPKIRKAQFTFEDGHHCSVNLRLPQIHCSSCIYLLENLPEIEEGILEVKVHFPKKQAHISFRSDIVQLSQVATLLDYIGYPPDFQTKAGQEKKQRNMLLIQLGVAGFFFGNTMLLALPEYLHASDGTDAGLRQFFRYLMMAFSLPVVAFSGKDYFINAAKSLRAGVLSIDLPIALGVAVLFLRSAYEVISGLGPGYFDSLTGLLFFLLIGKWYQQKTYENFTFDRDFRSFIPLAANLVLKNGNEKSISVDDLAEGDTIVVRQGEILPADAILESARAQVDYSYITGESIPLTKKRGEKIFAGARLQGGAVQLRLTSTVDQSYLSSLWSKDVFVENSRKKSRGFTDKLSRYFTPLIILVAVASAVVWSFIDVSKAVTVFTAVLIVACPCALALAEPFASGSMMRRFGQNGFYLKNADVLNRLAKINHIVFDKTGTLTQQEAIRVDWNGKPLRDTEKLAIASVAKNAQHPLAKPLLEFLQIHQADASEAVNFIEASGQGVTAEFNGEYYRMGKASFVGLEKDKSQATSVYVEKNGGMLGYFCFHQQVRKELKAVLTSLGDDFKLSLLSGDNDAEYHRFQQIFGRRASLQFNQSPHQKLRYMENLQSSGEKVLMIGDGLNDAGALQQSEVGISLCEKNVNFFPASDALLIADSFGKLGEFIRLSHRNRKVIYYAFGLSLLYNLVGIGFAVTGVLSPLVCAILMPVSSVSVVIFTTLANRWSDGNYWKN